MKSYLRKSHFRKLSEKDRDWMEDKSFGKEETGLVAREM